MELWTWTPRARVANRAPDRFSGPNHTRLPLRLHAHRRWDRGRQRCQLDRHHHDLAGRRPCRRHPLCLDQTWDLHRLRPVAQEARRRLPSRGERRQSGEGSCQSSGRRLDPADPHREGPHGRQGEVRARGRRRGLHQQGDRSIPDRRLREPVRKVGRSAGHFQVIYGSSPGAAGESLVGKARLGRDGQVIVVAKS